MKKTSIQHNAKAPIAAFAICLLSIFGAKAGSVSVSDFDISAFAPNSSAITSTISAIWGTYSGGVFTPLLSSTQSAQNTGYLDGGDFELFVGFTQSDNNNITAGTSMFVSIFNVLGGAGTSTWSSSVAQIVLSDPSWVAPTFTLTTPQLDWALTADTTAMSIAAFGGQTGTYSFNGGSPEVTLAVPEPSTYALLVLGGLAVAGHVIRRRRRA